MHFSKWKTFDDAYESGYSDGENSAMADLTMIWEGKDLPFDFDGVSSYKAVKILVEFSENIKRQEDFKEYMKNYIQWMKDTESKYSHIPIRWVSELDGDGDD